VDPAAVQSFLAEIAAHMDQLSKELAGANHERTALKDSLKQATAKTAELEKQVAVMTEKLAFSQQDEGPLKRAFLAAQKFTEEVTQAAKTIAAATASAEQTTRAAHAGAAETLDAARKRAEEIVQAAERATAARLARLQAEIDPVTAHAQQQITEITQRVEQQVGTIEALVSNHAEPAKTAARLHTEVRDEVLPGLRNLLQQLKERGPAALSSLEAVGAAFTGLPVEETTAAHLVSPAEHATPGALTEAVSSAPKPAPPAPAPAPGETPGVAKGSKYEIVVSPISTYSQAAIFLRSLLQINGVESAKMRKYTLGSTATFEVTTSYGTFPGGGIQLVGEFPVEVVEASDVRMVLRIQTGGASSRTA